MDFENISKMANLFDILGTPIQDRKKETISISNLPIRMYKLVYIH
jgi:hypothetical protein